MDIIIRPKKTPVAKGRFHIKIYDIFGNLRDEEEFENLVVTTGLNALLDSTFRASSYTAAWFVGLKATGTVVAGDTMASHAGWTEVTAYSEATRPAYTPNGAASAGAISNSSSVATFTMNGTVSVFGSFLTSNSTKGGTTGILYDAGNFSTQKDLESGEVLTVRTDLSVA